MTILTEEVATRDNNSVSGIMGTSDALGHIENIRTVDGRLLVNINDSYYPEMRLSYDGANVEYIGKNILLDATISGTDWNITKLSYDGANITRSQQTTGAWSARGGLF